MGLPPKTQDAALEEAGVNPVSAEADELRQTGKKVVVGLRGDDLGLLAPLYEQGPPPSADTTVVEIPGGPPGAQEMPPEPESAGKEAATIVDAGMEKVAGATEVVKETVSKYAHVRWTC
jgi:hypothetical protein